MKRDETRKKNETTASWEQATSRPSADLLAILAPTGAEPRAIQRAGIWKTAPLTAPAAGSAA